MLVATAGARVTGPVRRVLELARPHRAMLVASVALGALAVGAAIGLMATSGYLITRAAQHPPILSLGVAIVAVRFFGVARGVLRYLERLVSHDATLRVIGTLRVRLFARIEPLVPGSLGSLRLGDALSRFVGDVDALQGLLLRGLYPPAVAIATSLLALAIAAAAAPTAALVLAGSLGLAGVLLPAITARAVRSSAARVAAARARLGAELVESFAAAAELVAFGAETDAITRIERADRELARLERRGGLIAAVGEGAISLLSGVGVLAVIVVAAPAVERGSLSGPLLGMLALLALASFEAVRPLPAAAQQRALGAAAAARVFELCDREPSVRDPADPRRRTGPGRLQVHDVCARYGPDEPWVLEHLDLVVGPGEIVALVGPSGSGKSTLADLLVRFRDPQSGSITLDGIDLRALAQADVRRAIGLAGQGAHLFPTSIRENLRIARPGASDEELADALRRAHAWELVAGSPDGLSTPVGEEGGLVSGGQRQRIALARALLADVLLLVLDEPAASLDEPTADAIVAEVVATARAEGIGLLLITHRAAEAERADRVVELAAPAWAG